METNILPLWLNDFRVVVEVQDTEQILFDSREDSHEKLDFPHNGGHKSVWGGENYKDNFIKLFNNNNEWETFKVKGVSISRYDYLPEHILFDYTIRISV